MSNLLTGIILFTLLTVLTLVDCFNYCDITCNNEKHILCKYPAGGGPECAGRKRGLSFRQQKNILHVYNTIRNKMALGETALPKAADMMLMRWGEEEEWMAQRWADQCMETAIGSENNVCTQLAEGDIYASGSRSLSSVSTDFFQNMSFFAHIIINVFIDSDPVDTYFKPIIKGYLGENDDVSVPFFFSRCSRVGCGLTYKEYGSQTSYSFVCMYTPSRFVDQKKRTDKVYSVGEACSQCPSGTSCSENYRGLCAKTYVTTDQTSAPALNEPGSTNLLQTKKQLSTKRLSCSGRS